MMIKCFDVRCPTLEELRAKHPALAHCNYVLGVDVGVRNLGLALLVQGRELNIFPIALSLYDLGTAAMRDKWTLNHYLGVAFRQFMRHLPDAEEHPGLHVTLAIETQEKQRSDAFMVMVAGMCQQAFCQEVLRRQFVGFIAGQSPSCPTSVEVQRALGMPIIEAVTKREDKKRKAVAMLEHWLNNLSEEFPSPYVEALRQHLCVVKNRAVLKSGDRRDHVADAALHAYYFAKKNQI